MTSKGATIDVGGWLRGLGLGQYEAAFRDNAIDDTVLPNLTAEDLRDLGVGIVGHRRKMLDAISALRASSANAPSPVLVSMPPPTPVATETTTLKAAGERRHLTVMFCDFVDSTHIMTRLDAEEWRDLVGGYLDAASTAVREMGGQVAKKLGNGLIALFGYPVGQENDVERAAHAALVIQRSVTELNRKNDATGKPALATRIAIDSGPVVINAAGEIFGEAPNFAARAQALAEPSAVVTTRVRHQIPGLVAEERGSNELKGVPKAVTLYGIVRASGGGHPMTDYHQLIARAVEGLDRSTGEARRALYERARNALVTQLRSNQPALLVADITKERLALEEAIRKVEAEAARKSRIARTETRLEARSATQPAGTPDGGAKAASAPPLRDRTNSPSADLPGRGWPAVLSSARDRLLSGRSSLRNQRVKGLRDVARGVHDPDTVTTEAAKAARQTREAYEPEAPQYPLAEESARSSHNFEPLLDPQDLNPVDYDTRQERDYEHADEPEDQQPVVLPPVQHTLTAQEEEYERTRPPLSYRGPPSLPRPNWSRPLPRLLVVSGVMTVATLNDARVLIERHLPTDTRVKEMWRYVSTELRETARGNDTEKFSSHLQMALSLEGLEWSLK